MCGIAALFCSKEQDLAMIATMTQKIDHRGPDDEGYVLFTKDNKAHPFGGEKTPEDVWLSSFSFCPEKPLPKSFQAIGALGHRRLSILDLTTGGHQPMSSQDGKVWITFNGEIYNFKELRQQLIFLGHVFETKGDTEVIIKAYLQFGKHCLHHLNGMFSFVIFDQRTNTLFAVRDRFGVKPLYYWISPLGFLAFASEIKQFTKLPGWEARVDIQSAYDFLAWGVTDHRERTFFKDVFEVSPGESIELSLAQLFPVSKKKWYTLLPKPFKGSFQEASYGYFELLKDAVSLRMRSDVPLGSCLSGGLDSSSIVCLIHTLLKEGGGSLKQKTFSSLSLQPKLNEKPFIDIVQQAIQADSYFELPSLEGLLQELDLLTWHQDAPFISTSIFAQWNIFKTVKKANIKVVLDGQGADEQLAGYPGFLGNRLFDLFFNLRLGTLLKEANQAKSNPWPLLINKFLPEKLKQPLRKYFGKTNAEPSWLNLSCSKQDPFVEIPRNTLFDQSLLQMTKSNLPMLLRYEDRDSMAHSVESRTPFLDFRLVEFTLGLPSDYKLSSGIHKKILREAMKGVLPEPIRLRQDKVAFATDEEIWMKTNPSLFKKLVQEAIDRSFGIIQPEAFALSQNIFEGRASFQSLPWRLISFGNWLKVFSVCKK